MEPKSPENPTQARDIPREILSGRTTTQAVRKDSLQCFKDAASQTGFEIEVIAENPGEEYPILQRPSREPFTKPDLYEPRGTTVTRVRLGEGSVAIAVRRPATDEDFDAFSSFWDEASKNVNNR